VSERQRVGIAEFRVASAPAVLVSYGLGSCLAIALYDRERRLGGLAHTLLPAPRPGVAEHRGGKFVAGAIHLMLEELLRQGAGREALTARVAGGANMFVSQYEVPVEESIGARNVRTARETLQRLSIPLRGEEIGGSHGRTVEFDLATGLVHVRSVGGGDRILQL
jgi:chemotaxis protein CheD